MTSFLLIAISLYVTGNGTCKNSYCIQFENKGCLKSSLLMVSHLKLCSWVLKIYEIYCLFSTSQRPYKVIQKNILHLKVYMAKVNTKLHYQFVFSWEFSQNATCQPDALSGFGIWETFPWRKSSYLILRPPGFPLRTHTMEPFHGNLWSLVWKPSEINSKPCSIIFYLRSKLSLNQHI